MKDYLSVLVVIGTRPEAIKMSPLIIALKADAKFRVTVCITSQHREMLRQVLDLFQIKEDFDLDIMRNNQTPAEVAARILSSLTPIFERAAPDLVLVHGDTITASAAATAAYLGGISVGHVEAGLRTQNLYEPWPEEGNRKIIGALSQYHFAPTDSAKCNLLAENIPAGNILVTGNTVIDALLQSREIIKQFSEVKNSLDQRFSFLSETKRLVLLTIHRRESFGSGLESVCRSVLTLISEFQDIEVVVPVHPNPNISSYIRSELSSKSRVHLIEPQDYLPFIYLMERSHIIMTDSGGVQEEAPSLGKPVIVLRNTTERPEAVEAGTVKLVGTKETTILSEMRTLLSSPKDYEKMASAHNPYGDGNAVLKIMDFMRKIER